ncbi:MAG: MarR family winged helix-turn-helix transcriptional regulator [Candidatus Hodarchaeales archaeon]|jgi:DNA-binding MarR family transcriptional regulator
MKEEITRSLEPEHEIGSMPEVFDLVNKVTKKLDRFQRLVIRETGLTPPQYNVLSVLKESDGFQLSHLASACYSSRSTMTSLVDTLEKKGLVRREPNPKDRRSILVYLTEKGKTLKQAVPSLDLIFGSCCSGLEHDELQQLSHLLKKLEKTLNFGESCKEN